MKSLEDKVSESDVELIEGKGSKNHGGSKGGHYWHVYHKDRRVGRVYINLVVSKLGQDYASITVELNQDSRSKGIGTICFRQACELSSYDKVYAEMRKNNIASQKAAMRAGFKPMRGYKGTQMMMMWVRKKHKRS